MSATRTCDDKILDAISNVVEYSWRSELRDAEESFNDNGTIEGHIFSDIYRLHCFLNNDFTFTPDEFMVNHLECSPEEDYE